MCANLMGIPIDCLKSITGSNSCPLRTFPDIQIQIPFYSALNQNSNRIQMPCKTFIFLNKLHSIIWCRIDFKLETINYHHQTRSYRFCYLFRLWGIFNRIYKIIKIDQKCKYTSIPESYFAVMPYKFMILPVDRLRYVASNWI